MKKILMTTIIAGSLAMGHVQIAHAQTDMTSTLLNVAMLYLNAKDGYYYDEYYNRMPYGYVPPRNIRIERIEDMRKYRRIHPRPHYHPNHRPYHHRYRGHHHMPPPPPPRHHGQHKHPRPHHHGNNTPPHIRN